MLTKSSDTNIITGICENKTCNIIVSNTETSDGYVAEILRPNKNITICRRVYKDGTIIIDNVSISKHNTSRGGYIVFKPGDACYLTFDDYHILATYKVIKKEDASESLHKMLYVIPYTPGLCIAITISDSFAYDINNMRRNTILSKMNAYAMLLKLDVMIGNTQWNPKIKSEAVTNLANFIKYIVSTARYINDDVLIFDNIHNTVPYITDSKFDIHVYSNGKIAISYNGEISFIIQMKDSEITSVSLSTINTYYPITKEGMSLEDMILKFAEVYDFIFSKYNTKDTYMIEDEFSIIRLDKMSGNFLSILNVYDTGTNHEILKYSNDINGVTNITKHSEYVFNRSELRTMYKGNVITIKDDNRFDINMKGEINISSYDDCGRSIYNEVENYITCVNATKKINDSTYIRYDLCGDEIRVYDESTPGITTSHVYACFKTKPDLNAKDMSDEMGYSNVIQKIDKIKAEVENK